MPDDLSKRGPADRARVHVHETWEVKYWTGKWGCTEAELKAAVQSVGVIAEKVEAYLMHAVAQRSPSSIAGSTSRSCHVSQWMTRSGCKPICANAGANKGCFKLGGSRASKIFYEHDPRVIATAHDPLIVTGWMR